MQKRSIIGPPTLRDKEIRLCYDLWFLLIICAIMVSVSHDYGLITALDKSELTVHLWSPNYPSASASTVVRTNLRIAELSVKAEAKPKAKQPETKNKIFWKLEQIENIQTSHNTHTLGYITMHAVAQ